MFKKLTITQKVFFITAVMFFAYVLLTFLGQILFYGQIYTYYKREELTKQVEALADRYEKMDSREEINEALINFSKGNDSYVLIMGERGNILYTASYEMTLKTDRGDEIKMTIDNAVRDKMFTDLDIRAGDNITVEYYRLPSEDINSVYYIPVAISKGERTWRMKDIPSDMQNHIYTRPQSGMHGYMPEYRFNIAAELPQSSDRILDLGKTKIYFSRILGAQNFPNSITGTVSDIVMPDEHNFQSSQRKAESAWAAIQWISRLDSNNSLQVGERIHYIYQNNEMNSKYIVVVKKLMTDSGPHMIFAVNTLKSVDEAVEVMQDSHMIWFVIAFFMVVLISVIFSMSITRPIVNIMQVTTKMKNLDFTQKCVVRSDDELGMLGANINDMSEKLDNTIKELVSANKKLESDIEHERKMELARREFVAAVSHELKTPLAIIRAYSEGIADGVSGERRDKYLNVIIEETKKMDALVLDMLENSRLESGAHKLSLGAYDIVSMADKIVSRFKNGSDDKNVSFILEKSNDSITAEFDRDKLEQVMNNFISNAVRHTPEGGNIYVTVSEASDGVEFSVENEGSHIDEAEIDKVWDRFYKADKSRGRASGGTGLGLSIAKNILILHHADYSVENTEKGVKFSFKLKNK